MQPQQVLVWTCVLIFIATSIITLLGILRKIEINPDYLNKLFAALILEIIAIGILAFKESFKPAPVVEFVKIISPKKGYSLQHSVKLFIDGAYNISEKQILKGILISKGKTISIPNNTGTNNVYSAEIDSSMFEKNAYSTFILQIMEKEQVVSADSILLKN